jgi:cytochrome b561
MNWLNTTERYGSVSIALHWVMLALLVAVYACINLSDAFPKGSEPREALKAWHYTLGLSVFALVWLRLAARLPGQAPRIPPETPRWQATAATLVHVALYVLMIGLPLVGWLILSARGRPIPLFGLQLPALVNESRALGKLFKEVHEVGGNAGYFLVGAHAAAALFHHYVDRDDTLRRMLPARLGSGRISAGSGPIRR